MNYEYEQDLGKGITLGMVLIPAGAFTMGSPPDEADHSTQEGPQHRVTVSQFFMAKYSVTQAQWQAVAALPKVGIDLEPKPSRFRGDTRPVERISWYEALEFCNRLTILTNRQYRLPTEAEWEYACRAGTTTPFYFGETISPEVANYDGNYTYGSGPQGEFREETTPVGQFPANDFGLYDMHGNVWEWCLDHRHGNYDGAPEDGSAWLSDNESNFRILRGGSWVSHPGGCRSAYRLNIHPGSRSNLYGFRVVCLPQGSS